MDDCLERLIDQIESGEGEKLKSLILSERLSELVRMRLEMQAPFVSKWPQALSIQVKLIPILFLLLLIHLLL
jgi:ubiquinone biosynthesis protein COQ9